MDSMGSTQTEEMPVLGVELSDDKTLRPGEEIAQAIAACARDGNYQVAIELFRNSELEQFRESMENGQQALTTADSEAIRQYNSELAESQKIQGLTSILLDEQRRLLAERGIPKGKSEAEIAHVQEIVNVCREYLPELPVLQLIAAVHDLVKQVSPDYMAFGLHEIMSAQNGSQRLKNLLRNSGVAQEVADAVGRLAANAIFLHGWQEFPQNVGGRKKNELIRNRRDGDNWLSEADPVAPLDTDIVVIPSAGPDKFPIFERVENAMGALEPKEMAESEEAMAARFMVVAMNVVDKMVGSSNVSLIKYIYFYNREGIVKANSAADFIENHVLASFMSNLEGDAFDWLQKFVKDHANGAPNSLQRQLMVRGETLLAVVEGRKREYVQVKEALTVLREEQLELSVNLDEQVLISEMLGESDARKKLIMAHELAKRNSEPWVTAIFQELSKKIMNSLFQIKYPHPE